MTVAVTGASGFIGSSVVRQLLEQGRSVRAIIEPGANTKNLDALPQGSLDRVTVDVCDGPGMTRALSGCESLYHLAAIYRLWMPDPDLIFRVNLEGTTATMLAASKAGIKRIVYTSSIAAVGLHADGRPSDETVAYNLWDVANDYILTKHLSERIALKFASDGMPIVVVNPGLPFGPGDLAPTPTGKIIIAILKGELPGVTGGGFAAIDVDDCAKGHLLAEEKGRVGERYILINHNITYRDFFALVGEVANRKVINVALPNAATSLYAMLAEKYADNISRKEPTATVRAMRYAQQNVFFDNTKARTELGLPTRPLRETIQRAISFFQEVGYAS
ncbi:MAG: NAD-dependent epimerase/dehydratase family protein [Polyangiaceae bacterium]